MKDRDMEHNEVQIRRDRVESIAEYGIGLSLLAKGWDEAAHFADFPFRVIFIFFAGLFIIVGTKLRHRIEIKFPNFHGVFEILEGLVEIAAGSILLEKGKHFIPIFLAFIGLIYLSRGVLYLATKPENRESAFKTFRTIMSLAMIIFAATMGLINALTQHNPMVYFVSALLAGTGIFVFARRKSAPVKRLRLLEKTAKLLKK